MAGPESKIKLWSLEASKEESGFDGGVTTFNIKMVAPGEPGSYALEMGMYSDGLYFGEQLKVNVEVE